MALPVFSKGITEIPVKPHVNQTAFCDGAKKIKKVGAKRLKELAGSALRQMAGAIQDSFTWLSPGHVVHRDMTPPYSISTVMIYKRPLYVL